MSAPVVQSREGRRIVCRLGEGEDLLASIRAVCAAQRVRAATLLVTGVLDGVALAHYAKAQRKMGEPRWFRTPVQLLAAQGYYAERDGKPELQLQAVVSRAGDNGVEVFGGELAAAPALSCLLVIDAMDDVLLRCRVEPRTGLVGISELLGQQAAPPAAPSAAPPAPAAVPAAFGPAPAVQLATAVAPAINGVAAPAELWAAAASASAASAAPAEPEEQPEDFRPMRSGDLIDHATFGRCRVERVDSEGEFAIVRLRNKRVVRLSLDVLDLRFVGEEDGQQVFGPRER